jgi:hypothetical protein
MSDRAIPEQGFQATLDDSVSLYRGLLISHIDRRTQRILAAAFIRRPPKTGKDLKGISVYIAHLCDVGSV